MHTSNIFVLANTSWSDRWIPIVIVIAVIGLTILIGYSNFQNARPFRIEAFSSESPEDALDSLQRTFAKDGWVLGYRDAGTLVMSIDRSASLGSTAALGCLSVWMGLIHLLISNKRITVEIDADSSADGSLIVVNGSRSGSYLTYVAWHLRHLPKPRNNTKH